jgi:signal transduction histidine kinase
VTRILADADSASAALQTVIRAVCETEGWECGRYFRVDEPGRVLRFAEGWGIADPAVQRFVLLSRELVYRPGEGLSGLAWQKGEMVWATDVAKDPRSSKAAMNKIGSREIGIHGSFVFPIVSSADTLGVLNFATRRPREPEEQLLQAITAIGVQIAQFLRRREADDKQQLLEAQLHQAQKMQAIGTLATGIAHEFNNVLRAILANVELARMDAPQDHPVRESIEEIDKASRRARDIVQRILAFAALSRRSGAGCAWPKWRARRSACSARRCRAESSSRPNSAPTRPRSSATRPRSTSSCSTCAPTPRSRWARGRDASP